MQAISTQKFVRMSPRKLRLVADLVRGKKVTECLETLPFVAKRAALPILKVIKSAAANAQAKGASPKELTVSGIEISEAPRLKRFRAVSRGQAHGYVRAMSHIRVVVETNSKKESNEIKKTKKGDK
jgi:large subunit ribosomal protein L22